MRILHTALGAALAAAGFLSSTTASAQLPPPQRSDTWGTVSSVSAAVAFSSQLLMPRVYYADSETTIGWKARWHWSVLAPLATLGAVMLVNETTIKPNITSYRPGCGPSNIGVAGCEGFGMPSSHGFIAFSSLGHGTGVFLVDTLKWNNGRVNVGSVVGNIVVPLVASTFTFIGRNVRDPAYEHFDQVAIGSGVGLGFGLLLGATYSLLQVPDCGYGSGVVCW